MNRSPMSDGPHSRRESRRVRRTAAAPRRVLRTAVAAAVLIAVVIVGPSERGLGGSAASASPVGTVANFTGPGIRLPFAITLGPDGNLWFTNGNDSIGMITRFGVVSNFTGSTIKYPQGIVAGPDGNLWFVNNGNNSIGRITTAGMVSNFTSPGINQPRSIAAGPDGNLWFTNVSSVGRITPSGVVTYFDEQYVGIAGAITAGPDGNLWRANTGLNDIDRITPTGVVTRFADPGINGPVNITVGPDHNLWFTNQGGNSIGRITPSGVVSNFTDPSIGWPWEITAGPDGNLWFTNQRPGYSSVGRITPSGVVANITDPSISMPTAITTGSDKNLWFTNQGNDSIGRATSGVIAPPDPTGDFTPLTPARILDTRDGTGGHSGPLAGGSPIDVQITGRAGVPTSGVAAVVLNATVTEPTTPSWLTIWPEGTSMPLISNLNFVAGQTVPNEVTVAVGSSGKVSVADALGATHVIFDVVGFYADASGPSGSRFHAISPARLFDTRDGTGGVPVAPIGPGHTSKFKVTGKDGVPASGVTGVVMNVTVTRPSALSYLTVYPDDVGRPLASNLNFVAGQTVPNLVVMRVPASGIVDFYNAGGSTDLLADVVGFYDGDKSTEAGRLIPVAPQRLLATRTVDDPLPADTIGILPITGSGGVPSAGVGSVVLNVTVTQPTSGGYLTVFPDDSCDVPLASNLNFVAGQTVPNLVMVGVSHQPGCDTRLGSVDFYNVAGDTHVIVDVFGYFT